MALPILPNASNFLGVALVINRSRDGPRFVFHYPPHVQPVEGWGDKPPADDEGEQDTGDMLRDRSARSGGVSSAGVGVHAGRKQNSHQLTESGTQVVPWETVAGFPTKDLESILTPGRAYHKRLFQVSLDPLYCVSYPIHVPASGTWKKKKKRKDKDEQARSAKGDEESTEGGVDDAERSIGEADQVDVRDMAKASSRAADESEDKRSSMTMFNLVFFLNPKKHEAKDLVDVLFTQIIKKSNKAYKYCQQRSDFVWKESKRILAMKDKAREDKTKMNLLWNDILSVSSLAASMQDIYDNISQNKIAVLQLDTPEGMVTHSVQIHRPFHVADLGQDSECGGDMRGLWLTTANTFVSEDALEEPDYRDKNFALLLMDDEKKIIAELQTDPDETSLAMIEFVRHCKATLSFHQVAQQSSNILTMAQVRTFADHFIFWRRAIAIPPLHARDMYIVSPNCDLSMLPQAAAQWARTFPLAPALPNFLADLSVAPRPYKLHCPSKAHRPLYMAMLAWLVRGGWVTQLCTFAYVVVWPEIVYEVEHAMEAEEISRVKKDQEGGGEPGSLESDEAVVTGVEALSPTSAGLTSLFGASADEGYDLSDSTATIRNLSISTVVSQPPRPTSTGRHESFDSTLSSSPSHSYKNEALSPTSQRPIASHAAPSAAQRVAEKARLERIADKAAREVAERATAHTRKLAPAQTAHPSVNSAAHLAGISPHIILDAKKATGKESRYLTAIGQRLRDGTGRREYQVETSGADRAGGRLAVSGGGTSTDRKSATGDRDKELKEWDQRVAEAWPILWKYLNGRSALERIALQEDMKRKEVWNLLTAMSEYLISVRHW